MARTTKGQSCSFGAGWPDRRSYLRQLSECGRRTALICWATPREIRGNFAKGRSFDGRTKRVTHIRARSWSDGHERRRRFEQRQNKLARFSIVSERGGRNRTEKATRRRDKARHPHWGPLPQPRLFQRLPWRRNT